MSYQDQSGGYPPPREQDSQSSYPPPPDADEERRAYHQRAPSSSSSVTLPSISPYEPQYGQQPNGYAPDPRAYPPPDPYRQAAPGGYREDRQYQQDYGRGQPQHMAFSQSAPRQRTAIACRYCRRRKVSTHILIEPPASFLVVVVMLQISEAEKERLSFLKQFKFANCRRFVAQDSIKIPKGVARIANASSKNASSHLCPRKHRRLSLLTPSTQTCATWESAPMDVLAQCILKERSFTEPTVSLWVPFHRHRQDSTITPRLLQPARTVLLM